MSNKIILGLKIPESVLLINSEVERVGDIVRRGVDSIDIGNNGFKVFKPCVKKVQLLAAGSQERYLKGKFGKEGEDFTENESKTPQNECK